VVIELDTLPSPPPTQKHKLWTEGLTCKDKSVLLGGHWLNDDLINKAQELLKREFPYVGGLQPVALGMTMAFSIEPGEFVQILHTGHGHWITISTIGCIHPEVQVYDSLVPAPTSNLFRQVATLLATANTSISLKYVDVTMQNGSADCGLFAIAFATALINGCDPSQLFFDQAKMRHHLAKCIMAGKMSEFPVKKCDKERRNCYCRLPAFGDMIQCTKCQE